jgi:DNA-binding CsgD family transcriptional regulator
VVDDVIAEGRNALKRGDSAAAKAAFSSLGEDPDPVALEGLAEAAYLEHDFQRAITLWERTYAGYRDVGDKMGAIRTSRRLSYMYGAVMGDGAVMSGWQARAESLLAEGEDCVERGWICLNRGMFEGDRAARETRFREALDHARRFGDPNLEFDALAYLGANLVHDDRSEEGMLLLDEACAAVAGGDVDDFCVLEEIFCQTYSACEHAHDVARADQWIRIADEIAARRNLPAVSAFCRTHYGGILTTAGRWTEADDALTEAVRVWGLGYGSLRAGALIRLADLRVRQGRLEEAEQLLAGIDHYTESARPLAALHLARGDATLAQDVVERALGQLDQQSAAAAPLWALLVDVHLARDDVEKASKAIEQLDSCANRLGGYYLGATAALARGKICLAGKSGDPSACLREALSGFAMAQMPMELAHARFELARALAGDRPEVAIAEARAALDGFERLQAARHADAAAALIRSLGGQARTGPKGADTLTKREAEVLELLGLGLSNPEISDRLFVTRKTVEHHVGRVLSKLGLRNRAEAAAYAAREGRPASR